MDMTDKAGADAKVIAVPHDTLSSIHSDIRLCVDVLIERTSTYRPTWPI